MKKCLIEAPFTFDAGPPIIAIKYSFYKYYLGCDKFKDMDGALYKFLDYNLEAYNHLLLLQRILFDAIICRIRKIKTSHF